MRETIIDILSDLIPDFDENEQAIIDGKVLDSLRILQLIMQLNDEFDVSIPAGEIKPVNFNSVDNIEALITRLVEEE